MSSEMVEMRRQEDDGVLDVLCLQLGGWSAMRMDGNFRLSIHVHLVFPIHDGACLGERWPFLACGGTFAL